MAGVEAVIGRLALKVYPNTDGFREQVKAQAEKIESSANPIEIPLAVNDKEAKRSVKSTKAVMKSDLDGVTATPTLDDSTVSAETASLRNTLEDELSRIKASINLDNSGMAGEVASLRATIEAGLKSITANLQLNSSHLHASMEAMLETLQLMADRDPIEVPVRADYKSSAGAMKGPLGKLRNMVDSAFDKVTLGINTDSIKSLSAEFAVLATGMGPVMKLMQKKIDIVSHFDQFAVSVGSATLAIETLGGVLLAATGNMLSWGKDLASISALLIPMPGVMTGVGLAAWSMANAFKDAGTYLPKFKGQWEGLKKSMSASFWSQAQKPMQTMIDKLFPDFSKGMIQVSRDMGGFTGALAKGFTSTLSDGGRLLGMMDNLSRAVKIASQGADDLAEGISRLLSVGMAQLPALANTFNDLSFAFADFMRVNEANGNFGKWIAEGVTNFKALLSIVGSAGSIFGGLATAVQAAGASTLSSLSDTMSKAAAVVNSGPFQAALTSFMTDVYSFTGQLGQTLGNAVRLIATNLGPVFGQALAALGPTLSTALNGLFTALTSDSSAANFASFFEGLRKGVLVLIPAFEAIGTKIPIVLSLVGKMFETMAVPINAFFTELADSLATVQAPLEGMLTALGGSLGPLLAAMQPGIHLFAEGMAQLFTALTPVYEAMKAWAPVVSAVATILGTVFKAAISFITPILVTWAAIWPQIAAALAPVVQAISELVTFLAPLAPVLGAIAGIIVSVFMSALLTLVQGVGLVIEGIKQTFTGIIQFVTGVFTGNWSQAWEGIKNIFFGLLKTIAGAFLVWGSVTLIGILRGGLFKLMSLWQGGWAGIKNFAVGLWNGIKGLWNGFWTGLVARISAGIARVKALWNGGWNAVKSYAAQIWASIKTGVQSFVDGVKTKVTNFVQAIKDGIGKALDAAKAFPAKFAAAGAAIVAGLVQGVKDRIGDAVSAVKDMGSQIIEGFKARINSHSPSRVFRELGSFVSEGAALGIADKAKLAVDATKDMADAIASVPFAMQDVEAPNMAAFSAKTMTAVTGVSGTDAAGSGVVVNNTFNAADMDASDVARSLRFTLRQEQMSGRYSGGNY